MKKYYRVNVQAEKDNNTTEGSLTFRGPLAKKYATLMFESWLNEWGQAGVVAKSTLFEITVNPRNLKKTRRVLQTRKVN